MKQSCGIDVVEVKRMEHSLKNPRFLTRCFTPEELAYFETRATAPRTVAAHFAAKEAFGKLFGTGLAGFSLLEVSVSHTQAGAPYFTLTGEAAKMAEGWELSLSLTHDAGIAAAVAVGIKPD